MNVLPKLHQPNNPIEGDLYYDLNIGTSKMYIDGEWHSVNTNDKSPNYIWIKDTTLPYAKILNGNWLKDNLVDIKHWLDKNNAGEYIPELSSIMFVSHDFATFFELKWR